MDLFQQPIAWASTKDPDFPYTADVDGVLVRIRLNDFPTEPLYTLMIAETPRESFDDWPASWSRPQGA